MRYHRPSIRGVSWLPILQILLVTACLAACSRTRTRPPDRTPPPTRNQAPSAHAGVNQTVAVGSNVTLDGRASQDPDGDELAYRWTLRSRPSGSAAALSRATTVRPSFTPDVAGTYLVQLVVNDGKTNSPPSSVMIDAEPAVAVSIHYRGSEIVLIREDDHGYGADAIVQFDMDGDGIFEEEVRTDAEDRYTISLDASALPSNGTFSMRTRSADGTKESPVTGVSAIRNSASDPSSAVPSNLLPANSLPPEPGICSCVDCPPTTAMAGQSLDAYTNSYTPSVNGVELATGKVRQHFPVINFDTRVLGFDFWLHHSSLVAYDGPAGQSMSHSFNLMIVQTGPSAGLIATPDLRVYEIRSEDGESWVLPDGFFARLILDPALRRWTLTHYSGLETSFYQGALNHPGLPLQLRDPNGNMTRLEYDPSGFLQRIVTDLGQVQTLGYDDGRIAYFTDHLKRTWRFEHDAANRLTDISTPAVEYAQVEPGQEITDSDLADVLTDAVRTTRLIYGDSFPNHLSAVTDPRGAVPVSFDYDDAGRARSALVNARPVQYMYEPASDPAPLPRLEVGNRITRVVDREGNVADYEMHGSAGGPTSGRGQFGIRRHVAWTERGKGNEPLRETEPRFYEQRWLQDCNCLAPRVVTQPFSEQEPDTLVLDPNGIPINWPRDEFTYNANRQVTRHVYTDGIESITTESTHQPYSFGDVGQYSRLLSRTDPREFDANPIYSGQTYTHRYTYDGVGNLVRHAAPTVTRGVASPQSVVETWRYNGYGQVLSHTDPNGNVTAYTYYEGLSHGGDINVKGDFGGYRATVTHGAPGSYDTVTNLTTSYKVNPLGMVTQKTDPKGFVYDFVFNDLGEMVGETEPTVTLHDTSPAEAAVPGAGRVRYESRYVYDGAGNVVMHRRSNVDIDGSKPQNDFIDRSMSYDAVNNLLSLRTEVDADSANDLINRYAYDGNDDLAVTRKPEGNRTFILYDERRLRFKTFYGVAPGDSVGAGYPVDERAEDLGSTEFVGTTVDSYDARRNPVRVRDGRGFHTDRFFDFFNRQVSESDPNGNGWARTYDDGSNVITTESGAVSKANGAPVEVFERIYTRLDELAREYQTVHDSDLATDERAQVDPEGGDNSSYATVFDAGSRVAARLDANGNPTTYAYDAADRQLTTTDALGNFAAYGYDANSNIVSVSETEVAGPGAVGGPETYVMTSDYDELNRRREVHVRGLGGNGIDHRTVLAYDSRHNRRLIQDAEGNVTLSGFDDLDREIETRRFDGDPFTVSPSELQRYEYTYDRNSRKIEDRAFTDVDDPNSVQVTRYAYDNHDRLVRTVYPDSDDPADGNGDGSDGVFDRIEVVYDANANSIRVTEQRGVVFANTFDQGNRLTRQDIVRPAGVPGVTRQGFAYDALNRLTSAQNDFSRVDQTYDALSRLTSETQSIRLDGTGFTNGWQHPVQVSNTYDVESNRTGYRVLDGVKVDLAVTTAYDKLNRVDDIEAQYFDHPSHLIADYAYLGPWRVHRKTLGNGAALTRTFDAKRRVASHEWEGPSGTLVGFAYDYDRVDNPLFERFTHDNGLYDRFTYNKSYELTHVQYRSVGPTSSSPYSSYEYDALYNRVRADFSRPFDKADRTVDTYAISKANEYAQITRDGVVIHPTYDGAGNTTRLPVRPVTGLDDQKDVVTTVRWDAFNLLFDVETGVNPHQHYRYDPFRRRIATLELSGSDIGEGSRRYVFDAWSVVEERQFEAGATTTSALSSLDRIYVNGREIDEPLLVAIDRDRDGQLGGNMGKNVRDVNADQEYFFLDGRLGSVMGLLDADNPDRMLEYYRYTVYGEATVLSAIDYDNDGLEDTPNNLGDNFASDAQRTSEEFGNQYLFAARRFDDRTGLHYFRNRYYEARVGRFTSRDPVEYLDGMNLFAAYFINKSVDPFGTQNVAGSDGKTIRIGDRCRPGSPSVWLIMTWRPCSIPHTLLMNVQDFYEWCGKVYLSERLVFVTTHRLEGTQRGLIKVRCIGGRWRGDPTDLTWEDCAVAPLDMGIIDQRYTGSIPQPGGGTMQVHFWHWESIENIRRSGYEPFRSMRTSVFSHH